MPNVSMHTPHGRCDNRSRRKMRMKTWRFSGCIYFTSSCCILQSTRPRSHNHFEIHHLFSLRESLSIQINLDLPHSFTFIMYRFLLFLCTSLFLIAPSLAAPLPAAMSAPIVEPIPMAKRAPLPVEIRDAAAQGDDEIWGGR